MRGIARRLRRAPSGRLHLRAFQACHARNRSAFPAVGKGMRLGRWFAAVAVLLAVAACAGPGAGATGHGRGRSRTAGAAVRAPTRATGGYRLSELAMTTPDRGYGLFLDYQRPPCLIGVAAASGGGARFTAPVTVTTWRCAKSPPAGQAAFDSRGDGFVYGPALYPQAGTSVTDGGTVSRPNW
jgi:hypothetical protein